MAKNESWVLRQLNESSREFDRLPASMKRATYPSLQRATTAPKHDKLGQADQGEPFEEVVRS